jgi:hypothetical protein
MVYRKRPPLDYPMIVPGMVADILQILQNIIPIQIVTLQIAVCFMDTYTLMIIIDTSTG